MASGWPDRPSSSTTRRRTGSSPLRSCSRAAWMSRGKEVLSQGGHSRGIRDGRSRPPLKPPSRVAALRRRRALRSAAPVHYCTRKTEMSLARFSACWARLTVAFDISSTVARLSRAISEMFSIAFTTSSPPRFCSAVA